MKKIVILASSLLMLAALVACGSGEVQPVTLKLVTHDSFNIGEETVAAFEQQTGHTLEIVPLGDAGEMLNQSILSKNNPLGDVIFGIDNAFLSRALENDILIAYESPELANIDASLKLDGENRALPVDYGDVCLNYDKAWFEVAGIAAPTGLDDLADPAYTGLTVVQNPATSSPGLAFLLATIDAYGEDGYLGYWEQLVENDVMVENGWSEAYYEAFTLWGGDRPIVVSYASSPPAEVLFAETELSEAPTASVVSDQSCFRQIEFVGILNGTEHEGAAQQLIDFMLGKTFQEDIPLNMFVFPSNTTAALPAEFVAYADIPDMPATVAPDDIAANREEWISAWNDVVLR
ncbi:MAG: thiamine ABC transporter substrate binding subunit [Anaerolineae bacterium]